MEDITVAEARQNALNALNDIVLNNDNTKYVERVAHFLLTAPMPILSSELEPEIIVERGGAPYVPCDCPVCGIELSEDDINRILNCELLF